MTAPPPPPPPQQKKKKGKKGRAARAAVSDDDVPAMACTSSAAARRFPRGRACSFAHLKANPGHAKLKKRSRDAVCVVVLVIELASRRWR